MKRSMPGLGASAPPTRTTPAPQPRWQRWLTPARAAGSPLDDRISLGPTAKRSALERIARDLLARAGRTLPGRLALRALMRDPEVRAEVMLFLSDFVSYAADFDAALRAPGVCSTPDAFEDLIWLFSSNWLNHRFTRLDLDEAAYVFRLARSLGAPPTVELGRFRGGTTVLLAAAGARVVSIDSHPLKERWVPQLERALERLGLRERVELVNGDTRSHPPGEQPNRLLVFDASVRAEALRAEIEHWWPTLAPGGRALFRDGRPKLPHLAEVAGEVERLVRVQRARRLPDEEIPGALVLVVKAQ